MVNDLGCPTCGSKNFGIMEMEKNNDGNATWRKQCYNCKKFWYSEY
ncbi:hypothetical protein K0U27_07555 [archaeon]|nr:hypothetical protein [archaeon]